MKLHRYFVLYPFLALWIGTLAQAQPFEAEPGALFPVRGAAAMRYFVPVGSPAIPSNIHIVFGRDMVDFDNGKPIGIANQNLQSAPRIFDGTMSVSGPVSDSTGKSYYSFWCGGGCVWDHRTHGRIGSDSLSLGTVDVLPKSLVNAMSGSTLTAIGMPLRELAGYQMLRMGRLQWAKVYMVQTLGPYVIERKTTQEMGENIVMFSSVELEAMLPGDDYFYLTIGRNDLHDWSPILRINFQTGLPVTKHQRVKAVDLAEIQTLLGNVMASLRKHYPGLDEQLTCTRHCPFVALANETSDRFTWTRSLNEDAAALTNHMISERFFKDLIK